MGKVVLIRFELAEELAAAAAAAWMDVLEAANRRGETQTVVLSGGRITRLFFGEGVREGKARRVDFSGTHFFWADERCVPPDDAESNYAVAARELFEPLGIGAERRHRFRGEDAPSRAAAAMEDELKQWVPLNEEGTPVLSLVFLGMGEDGHVASLFPGAGMAVEESRAVCLPVIGPKPPPRRLTLTYRVLAAARRVWVLSSGAGKEGALGRALAREPAVPLGRLIRKRSETRVFTDARVTGGVKGDG
jgi:6-phosphogluconolactonase